MGDTQTDGARQAGAGPDRARASAEHLQAAARGLIAAARAALDAAEQVVDDPESLAAVAGVMATAGDLVRRFTGPAAGPATRPGGADDTAPAPRVERIVVD
jgi:hypothetical protein